MRVLILTHTSALEEPGEMLIHQRGQGAGRNVLQGLVEGDVVLAQ